MAGVSGPMFLERRANGTRFLVGLTVGAVASGLVVSLAAYLLGAAVQFLGLQARLVILAFGAAALGIADLFNRTPHVWRQVPQPLVRLLPPGRLGAIWGVDIGLLITTQKVVSLGWAAIAAVVLLEPTSAPAVLTTMAVLSSFGIAYWSLRGGPKTLVHGSRRDRAWLRSIRIGSGLLLLVSGMALFMQALST